MGKMNAIIDFLRHFFSLSRCLLEETFLFPPANQAHSWMNESCSEIVTALCSPVCRETNAEENRADEFVTALWEPSIVPQVSIIINIDPHFVSLMCLFTPLSSEPSKHPTLTLANPWRWDRITWSLISTLFPSRARYGPDSARIMTRTLWHMWRLFHDWTSDQSFFGVSVARNSSEWHMVRASRDVRQFHRYHFVPIAKWKLKKAAQRTEFKESNLII